MLKKIVSAQFHGAIGSQMRKCSVLVTPEKPPPLVLVCLQAGEDLHVWGTGSPLRQFIYNVDLGALMVRNKLFTQYNDNRGDYTLS